MKIGLGLEVPRCQALASRFLDARPWPRGSSMPNFMALASNVQALALRAALTFFASPSNLDKLIINIIN